MPSILANANAILAIPNTPGIAVGPITGYILQENGVDKIIAENGTDLMIRE
tara:strand:+ start:539 stop:691 length:153 start_codon:yes stop_codon:yes gene_type:complete